MSDLLSRAGAIKDVAVSLHEVPDSDAVVTTLIRSCEEEASSRGAALLALERIGAIGHLRERPACMGETFEPVPGHEAVYERMLGEQQKLIDKLWMTA